MTAFLPPNLLALFAPRDPIPYLPPNEKLPHEKKRIPYEGVASFLSGFEDPKDTPPPTRCETREERQERKRKERAEQVAYKLEQDLALWDPASNPKCTEDPFKTLFVSRINFDTSESKLRREFESYGPVKRIHLCTDINTGKPRGYAFIEYEHERDMHATYKHADGKKIDGRRVLVDVERARTVKGWRPRRLGGGLGGTRKGGADVNTRFSGRDDNQDRQRSASPDRRDRRRGRSREPDRPDRPDRRRPSPRPDRNRRRSRSRDRRDRGDRERRDRDRDRNRDRDRERDRGDKADRDPNTQPEEGATAEGGPPEGQEKEREKRRRSRSRDRKRRRSRSRERKRSRSRDKDRKKSRRSRSKDRSRRSSRERVPKIEGGDAENGSRVPEAEVIDYGHSSVKAEPFESGENENGTAFYNEENQESEYEQVTTGEYGGTREDGEESYNEYGSGVPQ